MNAFHPGSKDALTVDFTGKKKDVVEKLQYIKIC